MTFKHVAVGCNLLIYCTSVTVTVTFALMHACVQFLKNGAHDYCSPTHSTNPRYEKDARCNVLAIDSTSL